MASVVLCKQPGWGGGGGRGGGGTSVVDYGHQLRMVHFQPFTAFLGGCAEFAVLIRSFIHSSDDPLSACVHASSSCTLWNIIDRYLWWESANYRTPPFRISKLPNLLLPRREEGRREGGREGGKGRYSLAQ